MIAGRKPLLWSLLGAATTVLVVSGCSSSSATSGGGAGSATSPPASPASSAAAGPSAAGTPIKIGLICSCSGAFGGSVAAGSDVAQAWVKSVNAAGGVDGHPVQLTLDDDASTPGTSVTDAKALISAHVAVIFDLSVLDETWEKQADAARIPVVGGNFSSPMYYTDPDFYPSGQTNDSVVVSSVLTAKAAGAPNFGELYCAESSACVEGVDPRRAAGKKFGVPDVYDASFSSTAPNYTAQCVAAEQVKAAAIYVGGGATALARIAQDCAQQKYQPIFLQNGTAFTPLLATSSGPSQLWASFPNLPFFASNPQLTVMDDAIDKYYPGLRSNVNDWSQYAMQAWTGGLLIEDALRGSGAGPADTVTAATMTKGLDSISGDTLDGLSPPLTFTAGQPHPVDCWYTGRLVNGKPALVDSGKLTCSTDS